jgi:hypothetical protein
MTRLLHAGHSSGVSKGIAERLFGEWLAFGISYEGEIATWSSVEGLLQDRQNWQRDFPPVLFRLIASLSRCGRGRFAFLWPWRGRQRGLIFGVEFGSGNGGNSRTYSLRRLKRILSQLRKRPAQRNTARRPKFA